MSTDLVVSGATAVAGKTAETVTGVLVQAVSKNPIGVMLIAAGTVCTLGYFGTRQGAEISFLGFKAKGKD
mgnify:CR=1 FL=1